MKKEKFIILLSFLFCLCFISGSLNAYDDDEEMPADITGKIGQGLKTDEFEITVTSVTTAKTVGKMFFVSKAVEGAVFVIVK